MLIALFIVSLLALTYFAIAKIVNLVAANKIAAYVPNGRNTKPEPDTLPAHNLIGIASGIVLGLVMFFWMFILNVGPQEVAVIKTPSGVKDKSLTAGWHIVPPWWTTYPMDKTVWVYTFSNKKTEDNVPDEDAIWAPTSEGIKMGFDMSISWKIDPEYASWIYQNVSDADGGPDGRYKWIENNIIRAKTKSVFCGVTVKFSPIECYSIQRTAIQEATKAKLTAELKTLHLILDQVDIREVFYDPGYEAELKNKKIQEQKALTMIEVTKQIAEQEVQAIKNKNIQIIGAQGEAEALRIKGNAIQQNPKIIQLNWIEQWDGHLPTTILGSGTNTMMMLPDAK